MINYIHYNVTILISDMYLARMIFRIFTAIVEQIAESYYKQVFITMKRNLTIVRKVIVIKYNLYIIVLLGSLLQPTSFQQQLIDTNGVSSNFRQSIIGFCHIEQIVRQLNEAV